MTKRRVWRYKCDHCKKSNCSAASIKRHEAGCCRNPQRYCDLCETQWPRPELVAIITQAEPIQDREEHDERKHGDNPPPFTVAALRLVADLSSEAAQCPLCMMAAIIHSGTKAHLPFDFPEALRLYHKENEDWEAERRAEYYALSCRSPLL